MANTIEDLGKDYVPLSEQPPAPGTAGSVDELGQQYQPVMAPMGGATASIEALGATYQAVQPPAAGVGAPPPAQEGSLLLHPWTAATKFLFRPVMSLSAAAVRGTVEAGAALGEFLGGMQLRDPAELVKAYRRFTAIPGAMWQDVLQQHTVGDLVKEIPDNVAVGIINTTMPWTPALNAVLGRETDPQSAKNTLAALADIADPLSNMVFGAGIEGIGAAGKLVKVPEAASAAWRGIQRGAIVADQMAGGMGARVVSALEQSPAIVATLTKAQRYMEWGSRVLEAPGVVSPVRTLLGGPVPADFAGMGAYRSKAAADKVMALTKGDSVARILEGTNPVADALGKDILAARAGVQAGTVAPEVATELEQRMITLGVAPEHVEAVVQASAIPVDLRPAYLKYGTAHAAPLDTIAPELKLPEMPGQVPWKTLTAFRALLEESKIPKWAAVSQDELDMIAFSNPSFATLDAARQKVALAGQKMVNAMRTAGVYFTDPAIAESTAYEMRQALAAVLDKQVAKADIPSLALDFAVAGQQAKAALVRAKTLEVAAQAGLDPNQITNLSGLIRSVDDAWGQIGLQTGYFTEEQIKMSQGLHLRRVYNLQNEDWWAAQARIEAMKAVDPQGAQKLEQLWTDAYHRWNTIQVARGQEGIVALGAQMTRDQIPVEVRALMDQWDNAADILRLTGKKMGNVFAGLKYMEGVYQSGLWRDGMDNLSVVNGFKVRLADTPANGLMRGKYVTPETAARIQAFAKQLYPQTSEAAKLWEQNVIGTWKALAVGANPQSWVRNAVGNVMSIMLGGNSSRVDEWTRYMGAAMHEMAAQGPAYRAYSQYSPSLMQASIQQELLGPMVTNAMKAGGTLEHSLLKRGVGLSGQLFEYVEGSGKLALYMKGIADGLTEQQAVLQAEKYLVNYADVPPWLAWLRRRAGVLPFATYTYKMAGNLLRAPIERPQFFMAAAKGQAALEELTPRQRTDLERLGIPEYWRDSILLRIPGPKVRYVNLDSYIPFNTISLQQDTSPFGLSGQVFAQILNNLGPPYKQILEIGMNRNIFTGGQIVPDGTDPQTAMGLIGKYLGQAIPQGQLAQKLWAAKEGLPATPNQQPQKWHEALLGMRNLDLNQGAYTNTQRAMTQANQYLKRAEAYLTMPNLTPEEKQTQFQNGIRAYQEQMGVVNREVERLMTMRNLDALLAHSGLYDKAHRETVSKVLLNDAMLSNRETIQAARDRVRFTHGDLPGNIDWQKVWGGSVASSPTLTLSSRYPTPPINTNREIAAGRAMTQSQEMVQSPAGPVKR